jgi:hypothetical protein
MQTLSAADAVTPAIHRTKDYLFRPFELGTYLKLCLVAVITEGLGGNFNMPGGGGKSHGHTQPNPHPTSHLSFSPEMIAMAIAAIALVIVVTIAIYYLVTRLRFAFFHCLIRQTKEIGPGWRLYRNQASRFFALSLVVGIIFVLLLAVIVLPFAVGIFHLVRRTPPGTHIDIGILLSYVLPLIPIFLLAVIVGIAIQVVLRDFMMPHMALENASAGEAWAAARARIVAEKGNFFVYTLLRMVMPIVGLMAIFMVLLIPGLILLGCTAIVFVALHSAFAQATGAAAVAGIMLQAVVGIAAFCILALAGIIVGGPLSVWVRMYALMFYGGRYQALGDVLTPLAPPPAPAFGMAPL